MRILVMLAASAIGLTVVTAESTAQTQTPQPGGPTGPSPRAQSSTPGQEKVIRGQVKSIDPSMAAITLVDGTTLVAPSGELIQPGLEGATVLARYREDAGVKVLIQLAVAPEPSASPRIEQSPGADSSTGAASSGAGPSGAGPSGAPAGDPPGR